MYIVTSNAHQPEKDKIAGEILEYLADHPDASDTLEGIVQWWLLERRIEHEVVFVESVLSELVEKGLIQKKVKQNQNAQYYLKRTNT